MSMPCLTKERPPTFQVFAMAVAFRFFLKEAYVNSEEFKLRNQGIVAIPASITRVKSVCVIQS
jgi:hypothetical protein